MTITAPSTPDEQVAAVQAALAEAGYPDAIVFCHPEAGVTVRMAANGVRFVPRSVTWKALLVVGLPVACWPCWSDLDRTEDCAHDPWAEPWPEVVR